MTALITAGAKIVAYEPVNPAAPIAAVATARDLTDLGQRDVRDLGVVPA